MATIGRFTQTKDGGWAGTIRTLTINAKVRLAQKRIGEYRLIVSGDCEAPPASLWLSRARNS